MPELGTAVALDVEKVRCKDSNILYAGHVVIAVHGHKKTNFPQSNIIFSAYIWHDSTRADLMNKYSGLTKKQISNGTRFEIVREDIQYFIENYKVVGCNVREDLKSLELEHLHSKCIDIQSEGYFVDKFKRPISLKILCFSILNKKIQDFDHNRTNTGHSALTDATVTIRLYHLRQNNYVQSETDSDDDHTYDWCRKKAANRMIH